MPVFSRVMTSSGMLISCIQVKESNHKRTWWGMPRLTVFCKNKQREVLADDNLKMPEQCNVAVWEEKKKNECHLSLLWQGPAQGGHGSLSSAVIWRRVLSPGNSAPCRRG